MSTRSGTVAFCKSFLYEIPSLGQSRLKMTWGTLLERFLWLKGFRSNPVATLESTSSSKDRKISPEIQSSGKTGKCLLWCWPVSELTFCQHVPQKMSSSTSFWVGESADSLSTNLRVDQLKSRRAPVSTKIGAGPKKPSCASAIKIGWKVGGDPLPRFTRPPPSSHDPGHHRP